MKLPSLILLALIASTVHGAVKPVVDAASRGDIDTVRQLLRDGADVNEAHGDGMTALHWAAERGDRQMTEVLLYAGSHVDSGTRIGNYTPLHIASRNGRAGVIEALLAAGANPVAFTTNTGVTPLHLAAASGDAASVRALLAAGAPLEATEGAWDQTPLIFGTAANRIEVMRVLLEAGADVSVTTWVVDTDEMEKADKAAEKRVAEFLAEFKAKQGGGPNWRPQPSQVQAAIEASRDIQRRWPNVPDPECDDKADAEPDEVDPCDVAVTYNADGEPIYDYPAESEDEENAAPKRKSYGQRVVAWGGLTPLLHAVRQGYREAALLLLEHGADINQVSAGDGTSPLLMAAINGQFDLALELLELGADPNLASVAGTTPLFAVLERQWAPRASYAHPVEHHQQQATHLQVMKALLDAGADPNVRLNTHLWFSEYTFSILGGQAGLHYKGATPFWRASLALDVPAMRLLKEYGADPGIPTVKQPERRRRAPMPEAAVAEADAQKNVTPGAEPAAAVPAPDDEEEDPSGVPEVPVGGPFIHPIHAASGAGYGQWFAGNAHQHAPDSWLPAVKFLVEECGADVNLRDANAYTPLHHAASRGDNAVVQYLIDKGADVKAVSRKGQTTVDMANGPIERLSPFPETIELLESYGAINNNNCVSC